MPRYRPPIARPLPEKPQAAEGGAELLDVTLMAPAFPELEFLYIRGYRGKPHEIFVIDADGDCFPLGDMF